MNTKEVQNKMKHKKDVKRKITFISKVTLITAGISDVTGLFLKESIVADLLVYVGIWALIYLALETSKIDRLLNFVDDEDADVLLCFYSVIEYLIVRIVMGLAANSQFVSRYPNMRIVIIVLLSAVVAAEIGCATCVCITDLTKKRKV